jgi:hypothetical protein
MGLPAAHLRFVLVAAALTAGCNSLFGIHEGTPRPTCSDPNMIDDFEDGDGMICQRFAGRNGGWFDFGDGSPGGELTPSSSEEFKPTRIDDGTRGTSRYAARFSGSGFTIFGAIMGFELLNPPASFDAGGLGGITFWMRSNVPVAVDFPTAETVPVNQGGDCGKSCNDHFTFQITAPAPGWYKYQVPFNALRGGGGSAIWNPRHLYGVNFRVAAGAPFDVWIDDVAFYACASPECAPTCTDPRFPVSCRAMTGLRSSCQPTGTDCALVASWCADPMLIDDMEDGDAAICESGSRQGVWYAVSDGTSTDLTPPADGTFVQSPIPGGRGTSRHAARLTGSGFTEWGALMGLVFNPFTGSQPYDASAADGITFWAKNDVPVYVNLVTPETTPPTLPGGQCADSATAINCNNSFAFPLTAPSSDWVEYKVPFAAFSQQGGSATWNPARLTDIDFAPADSAGAFDIWIDDLRFYNCSLDDCTPTCPDPALPVRCPARGSVPAGCRPPGTDCNTFVLGCGPFNTVAAPADGLVATFTGPNREADIPGALLTWGAPAPTFTSDGALHITVNADPTSNRRVLGVVDHFESCVSAAAFTGVQFTISGTVSGCTLSNFVEDSAHLFNDGFADGSHGTGPPGSILEHLNFAGDLVTPVPQTLQVPFTELVSTLPATPFDKTKITGLGWAFAIEPSSAGCVADLTVDDISFY